MSAFHPLRTLSQGAQNEPVVSVLSIEPIYGWGWTGAPPNPTRDTPEPFAMLLTRSERGAWQGVVQSGGHEFDGQPVDLSQRLTIWDGQVNVAVGPPGQWITQGWALVADHHQLRGRD